MEITLDIARKVLSTIDAGLCHGIGRREPGYMCVEAAVCYALGLPHGDDPGCVAPSLRMLKIKLNDSNWSSNQARAQGLRRLGLAQLGSAGVLDEIEFSKRVAKLAISKQVPAALRAAASVNPKHSVALLRAAEKCEKNQNRESATWAGNTAYAAADAAADDAAYAAAYADAAADNAAYAVYAADAADNGAGAAAYTAAAAYAATSADNAANAAYAATNATNAARMVGRRRPNAAAARDKSLADFAEDVVQILICMKAPGCAWLILTDAE